MSTVTTYLNLVKPAPLENFSRATYNTNLDLIDANALAASKQAKGIVQDPLIKIASSGFVTALTVIDNIASVAFKGGRKYLIVWDFTYQGNTAGNYLTALIGTAATTDAAGLTTGITQLNGRPWKIQDASIDSSGQVSVVYRPVSDITLQLKFLIQITTGAGNARISASSTQPTTYTIYDQGAQF